MAALVSIITPCYNVEKYVGRFLDSILDQTYPNIELIIINDGSTDNTENIILSYKTKFEDKGYIFIYISQGNAGQSAAINRGLQVFTGEFMTWLDSDDALVDHAIQTKVDYMQSHPSIGLSLCDVTFVDEQHFMPILTMGRRIKRNSDDLYGDLIIDKNVVYCPGCYMVRSTLFRKAMPSPLGISYPREIGQNYQLLLPVVAKYPWGYIHQSLYLYTVRRNSHSRATHTPDYKLNKLEVIYSTLRNIISDTIVDVDDRAKYERLLEIKNALNHIALFNQDKVGEIDAYIEVLKRYDAYGLNNRFLVLSGKNLFFKKLHELKNKLANRLKSHYLHKR